MQLITFFDFLYSVDFFFKMNLDSGKFRFKLREKTIHEFLILIQFCHLLEITSQTMLIVTLTYEWILCSGSQRAILLNKINSHHRPSIYTYITICTTIFAICEKKIIYMEDIRCFINVGTKHYGCCGLYSRVYIDVICLSRTL